MHSCRAEECTCAGGGVRPITTAQGCTCGSAARAAGSACRRLPVVAAPCRSGRCVSTAAARPADCGVSIMLALHSISMRTQKFSDGAGPGNCKSSRGVLYVRMSLGYGRHAKASVAVSTQLKALVLTAALRWFSAVPAWYGCWSEPEARYVPNSQHHGMLPNLRWCW